MRQLEEFKRFFSPAPDLEVILAFQGCFSQDVVVSLGEMVKNELSCDFPLNLVNKTFGILVEVSQNIMHYSLEKRELPSGNTAGRGSLILARSPEHLMLMSSNLVSINMMHQLNRRVKEINQMEQEELKNLYLIKRRQHKHDGAGAGLGLLDVARRSENPLGAGFLPEGVGKVRFFFRVLIPC